jgi:hypothetical protein
MNNWCICWSYTHILLRILIFKELTARLLYKSFSFKGLCFIDKMLIFIKLIVNTAVVVIRWFDGENRPVTGTVLKQDQIRFWHEISSFPDWHNVHPSLPNLIGRYQPILPTQQNEVYSRFSLLSACTCVQIVSLRLLQHLAQFHKTWYKRCVTLQTTWKP